MYTDPPALLDRLSGLASYTLELARVEQLTPGSRKLESAAPRPCVIYLLDDWRIGAKRLDLAYSTLWCRFETNAFQAEFDNFLLT